MCDTVTLIAAIGAFYFVSTYNYRLMLYIVIGLIAVSMLLWIRRALELLWALSFIAALALPIYLGNERAIMVTASVLASYILVQSLLTSLTICKESFAHRKIKGFVARVKWIPSIILGFLLVGQSLLAGYYIVSNFVFNVGIPQVYFEFTQVPWVYFSIFHQIFIVSN
ncbi:hypothetical protein [Bacillus sp. Marseille-P3661]|uniref:hypothetical protein n=1 Tax=Bacillus sp. Marseille-P3661 TaxID=1936234 RepID=UPI0015E1695D|nr:hypothetical protein [Bacillus sp. Marseille-P3661]